MRLAGQVLLACLIICALQAILAALAVGILLLLIWGLLFRTRETVGLLALLLFLKALEVHPLATIAVCAAVLACFLIARNKDTAAGQTVTPPPLLLIRAGSDVGRKTIT